MTRGPQTAFGPPMAAVESGPIRHRESSIQHKSAKRPGYSALGSLDDGPPPADRRLPRSCAHLLRLCPSGGSRGWTDVTDLRLALREVADQAR